MGSLEDAIKDHLELKRRQGASDQEVEELEKQALGPVSEQGTPLIAPPPISPVAKPEQAAPVQRAETKEDLQVPPQEALDEANEEPEIESPPESAQDQTDAADMLEETPEFLDQSADQEQLWFEQKPKDFDF